MKASLPLYAEPLFKPKRYKVLYGGRGSSKSYTVARLLILKARREFARVLCAREFQNSIAESVHRLLVEQIDDLGLNSHFVVTSHRIYNPINGSEFIFKGVHNNVQSIKSMQGITDLWLEEAQTVSQHSWDVLIPTIRQEGSEIWVTYNPENEDDPTHSMFVDKELNPKDRSDAIIIKVNWRDNPWFPDVLAKEKDYLFEVDPELAMHVWEGHCRTNSEAQIFRGKYRVEPFEVQEKWSGPYIGVDWGFSVDPTVMTVSYINTDTQELMIRYEAHGYHVELEDLPELFDKIPVSRQNVSRGDNARPETISYLVRKGFPMEACTKWSGSVEDGIEFLRTFRKIIVHPDCPETAKECLYYSYKTDRLTGAVTTKIEDAHNHCFDSIRYGLEPLITAEGFGILGVL